MTPQKTITDIHDDGFTAGLFAGERASGNGVSLVTALGQAHHSWTLYFHRVLSLGAVPAGSRDTYLTAYVEAYAYGITVEHRRHTDFPLICPFTGQALTPAA